MELGAGGGGVAAKGGKLGAEGSCETFVLVSGEVDRVAVGGGDRSVLSGYPSAGQSLFHLAEGDLLQFSLLRRVEADPDGREVS